ncbi:MAG: hypothetical protein ACXV8P_10805 [Methylobacter sp.]
MENFAPYSAWAGGAMVGLSAAVDIYQGVNNSLCSMGARLL